MAACDKPLLRFPVPDACAQKPHRALLLVRKSRFVAQCCRCESAEAARSFIAATRAANPDATHNCWAYVAGPPGDTARIGSSDDGEPHGTAGRPMLQVLLHSGIGQICMVVSRWFGGIKLGTGGLCRAYQDSALANLKTLPLTERVSRTRLRLVVEYARLDALRKALPALEAVVEDEAYHVRAEMTVALPEENVAALRAVAAGLGAGGAEITPV